MTHFQRVLHFQFLWTCINYVFKACQLELRGHVGLLLQGRFEILSLSGSFLLIENGGTRSRTGGLSVSLAGPDGRVVGGGVAGLLMAASPVQVNVLLLLITWGFLMKGFPMSL